MTRLLCKNVNFDLSGWWLVSTDHEDGKVPTIMIFVDYTLVWLKCIDDVNVRTWPWSKQFATFLRGICLGVGSDAA
jgi:hypothetical protein